jgi:hypothetical protein
MEPKTLYYNCQNPIAILADCTIKTSDIHSGVSFSEWSELGSHGPFKFEFKRAKWFKQFIQVMYWQNVEKRLQRTGIAPGTLLDVYENQFGEKLSKREYDMRREIAIEKLEDAVGNSIAWHRIWKSSFMFKDEREWYSPLPVKFAIDDVVGITFMVNAPCILSLRKLKQIQKQLREQYQHLYGERRISDPYLRDR